VYDVPRFTVADIRADTTSSRGGVALEVTLTGCNVNDYDLTADSLATQLTLGGNPASFSTYDAPFALPMRDSAQVIVALHVSQERLEALKGSGERDVPFALRTVGTVQTPMGARLVDSWHRGTLHLRDRMPVAWANAQEGGCHPGTSVLPAAAGRGAPLPTVRQPELPPSLTQPRPGGRPE
jgi:hypothetical protein